jgi:crossover junction endonuclease MUS81
MRDAAKEKGTKLAEVYHKACKSLQACPVTYDRPRDLVVLAGIGPKTVGILEVRWRKHCEENGIEIAPDVESECRLALW